jgi:8-oxo-dGTP pyrophosphatase MutT (NUDIX family)
MNDYSLAVTASLAAGVTRDQLRRWLSAAHDVAASGDARFSDDGESGFVAPSGTLKPAAVLVLVVNRARPTVLFTQRTAHLTDHAGQISFPGGRVEDSDRDATHTALREAEEETGVDASRIEILGRVPQYTTGTGYLITPVVGWVEPPVEYRPDPTEVAECFEVPFDFLTDISQHRVESAMYKGRMRSYYALCYGTRYIWGATAGMLVTLSRVIAAAQGHPSGAPVRAALDSGG